MKKIFFLMFVLSIAFFIYSLGFYNENNSKNSQIVKDYILYQSINDYENLKEILLDPKDIDSARYSSQSFKNYHIISDIDNIVKISYEKFCYNNPEIDFVLVDNKIDFKKTLRNIISESKNSKKNKEYCYEFKDQPLEGFLNGIPFKFNSYINTKRQMEDNEVKNIKLLFGEECNFSNFDLCKQSVVDISNIDLNGRGGNLSSTNNISVFNPVNDFNYFVNDGSYKVSSDYENIKVEISFSLDEKNYLNGYFLIKK